MTYFNYEIIDHYAPRRSGCFVLTRWGDSDLRRCWNAY